MPFTQLLILSPLILRYFGRVLEIKVSKSFQILKPVLLLWRWTKISNKKRALRFPNLVGLVIEQKVLIAACLFILHCQEVWWEGWDLITQVLSAVFLVFVKLLCFCLIWVLLYDLVFSLKVHMCEERPPEALPGVCVSLLFFF